MSGRARVRASCWVLAAAVTGLLLGAPPAAVAAQPDASTPAGEPVEQSFADTGSFQIRACSDPVRAAWDLTHDVRYWYDRDDRQWMGIHRVRGTWTFTNLETGYALQSHEAATARAYDFVRDVTYDENGRATGTVSWTRSNQGLHVPLNVPGDGRVLHDVGRLTFRVWVGVVDGMHGIRHFDQLTEAGQWSYWGFPDLCPYLTDAGS